MAKRFGRYFAEQLILEITLMDSDPKIWRRVEVHSSLTLVDLHYVIQNLFEWEDSHLYHYIVTPQGKTTRTAMREAVYYQGPHFDDGVFGNDENNRKAEDTLVGRMFTDDCKQILYEYDMGDSWQHLVKLEKRTPGGEQDHIPQCLAGENAAPLDDMGGLWGYYEFLAALKDKSHEMHDTAIEWLGEQFDPDIFDQDKVNRRLQQCFKPVPKKPRRPRKR